MTYLLRAIFELGLPVAALSWLLFYRLYSRGELARDADRKAIQSTLKQVKEASNKSEARANGLLHTKWMKFGGGFYGVAALWTLIVIEVSGVVSTLADPSSSLKAMFSHGLINFIVNLFVNQFTAFIQALIWFDWWPGKKHDLVIWFIVAYLGYLAGLNLARRETTFGSRMASWHWREQLRSWLDRDKDA